MAGLNIHFAIAKRYIEKNKVLDEQSFYQGTIDPDLAANKEISHYSGVQDKNNLPDYLKNKVLLSKYLDVNNIDTDYDKGVFLHLVTDYLWFNEFFDRYYINNTTYKDFVKDLYYSYDFTNPHIDNKYNMNYGEFREIMDNTIQKAHSNREYNGEVRNNIIPIDKLDLFIESVSSINLEEYTKMIKKENRNVLLEKRL